MFIILVLLRLDQLNTRSINLVLKILFNVYHRNIHNFLLDFFFGLDELNVDSNFM